MYSKLKTITNIGLKGFTIDVEIHISRGLPSFKIVGLPDKAIGEAKERVKAAIKSSGYTFPSKRIVINLAPSNIPKYGSAFDLPIALGILLLASDFSLQNSSLQKTLSQVMFFGELGLNGNLKNTQGIPIAVKTALDEQIETLILPPNSSSFPHNSKTKVLIANSLKECFKYIIGQTELRAQKPKTIGDENKFRDAVNICRLSGCRDAIRALSLAAAGKHHLLLKGPPGCGKSLLARSLADLVPIDNLNDTYEIERIYSISDETTPKAGPPFRHPHHTASIASIIGGGRLLKPGEITLAHKGILFLDELPQFASNVINALRAPLEDKTISISRKNYQCSLPCDFQLVAAMNRCPCGLRGHPNPQKQCSCRPSQIQRFLGKIPRPIMDRIDIKLDINPEKFQNLVNTDRNLNIAELREKILHARKRYLERLSNQKSLKNTVIKYKKDTTSKAFSLLKRYFEKKQNSTRDLIKILQLSRTIADFEQEKVVKEGFVAEAISYNQNDYI